MAGWAPLSGDQPMSFTIYSYDGKVTVGIACDKELVPDHEKIVDGFAVVFDRLLATTPGVTRSTPSEQHIPVERGHETSQIPCPAIHVDLLAVSLRLSPDQHAAS